MDVDDNESDNESEEESNEEERQYKMKVINEYLNKIHNKICPHCGENFQGYYADHVLIVHAQQSG